MIAPTPTVAEARDVVRQVLSPVAELLGGRLVVSRKCPRRGRRSRVCHSTVTARGLELRLRVVVTGDRASFIAKGGIQ